jgi:hypothetical protein
MTPEQQRWLAANHPSLAKRYVREQGRAGANRTHANANPVSQSNENNSPAVSKQPRLPGVKRDFGMLPATLRTNKGPVKANLLDSEKSGPVEGMTNSRHTELGLREETHSGAKGRDVKTALRMGR